MEPSLNPIDNLGDCILYLEVADVADLRAEGFTVLSVEFVLDKSTKVIAKPPKGFTRTQLEGYNNIIRFLYVSEE